MPKLKHKKFLYSTLILLIVLKAGLASLLFLFPQPTLADDLSATQILHLTNLERQNHNLNLLKPNAQLTQAAYNRALDIFKNNYFAHYSPTGKKFSDFVKEVGYEYFLVGENLAINFTDSQAVITAWEKSPTHYANLINPNYQEIGLAVVIGKFNKQSTMVVVQLFGTQTVAGITNINPQALGSPTLPQTSNHTWTNFLAALNHYLPSFITALLLVILFWEIIYFFRHPKKISYTAVPH